jgi:membrane-associated protein
MPDLVDGLLEALAGLHPSAPYLLAGLFTALETSIGIGLLIPGDSVVLLAATTVTTPFRFAALVAVTVLGSVTGESVGCLLGRRCGIRVRTSRLGRRLGEDRWVRAEAFLTGRGGRAVAAARFVAVVHALVPVVAGTVRMPYRRFVGWAVVGAVAWSMLYVGIGVAAGASWREYGDRLGLVGLTVGAVLVVVLVARATRRSSVPTARPPEGSGSGSHVGPRAPARSQPQPGHASKLAATPRSSGPEPAGHDPRGPGAARPHPAARQRPLADRLAGAPRRAGPGSGWHSLVVLDGTDQRVGAQTASRRTTPGEQAEAGPVVGRFEPVRARDALSGPPTSVAVEQTHQATHQDNEE